MFTTLSEILIKFIRRGLVLAALGQLLGATNFYKQKSAESLLHGLISLKSINQQLMGPETAVAEGKSG